MMSLDCLDVHGNLICSSVLVWVNQSSVSNISEEIGRGLIVFTSYTSPIKDQQQRFHHQDQDKKLLLVSSDWRERNDQRYEQICECNCVLLNLNTGEKQLQSGNQHVDHP